MINIMFHCDWDSDKDIRESGRNITPNHDYIWKDLYLTDQYDKIDYHVIFNKPRANTIYDPKKTIIFQYEPSFYRRNWGDFLNPDKKKFFKVFDINNYFPVAADWVMSTKYSELLDENNFI